MFYSKEFKSEVKRLYPDNISLIKAIEEGKGDDYQLEPRLRVQNAGRMSTYAILHATSLEELQEEARKKDARVAVYNQYISFCEFEKERKRRKRAEAEEEEYWSCYDREQELYSY